MIKYVCKNNDDQAKNTGYLWIISTKKC